MLLREAIVSLLAILRCLAAGSSEDDRAPTSPYERLERLTYLAFRKYLPKDFVESGMSSEMLGDFVATLLQSLGSEDGTEMKFHGNQSDDCSLESFPKRWSDASDFANLCERTLKTQCLTAEELVALLPVKNDMDANSVVARLCPLLLFQSHDVSCPSSTSTTIKLMKNGKPRPSTGAVWGFGILFVTAISMCSLVGVSLLPLMNKSAYHTVLMLFEGLAVGSLAGSAIFHLIPQAFNLLGQDAEHDYLWKSLIICFGIYLFFMSETIMKIIIEKKKDRKADMFPDSVRSVTSNNANLVSGSALGNGINLEETELSANHHNHSHHHEHGVAFQKGEGKNVIATVAWMIIFGDGLHNFIDGLSIGAAFSDSILSGISISVAVICEEFPHELGDFAVLLSAGMTMKQALMYNFLSACTCYVGLVFGILLGDLAEGGPYIFALAGGMFLYISLVDMVKELNEGLQEASKEGTPKMVKVILLQNAGILLGGATLFLMARYSERINFDAFAQNVTKTEFPPSIASPHNYRHEREIWKMLR